MLVKTPTWAGKLHVGENTNMGGKVFYKPDGDFPSLLKPIRAFITLMIHLKSRDLESLARK